MSYAYLFKYDLIGDSGVRKSCLLRRFTHNKFPAGHEVLIGDEFRSKIITIDNRPIKLSIWDTVVEDELDKLGYVMRCRYRAVAGALLVYDVTKRESFNRLASWLEYARQADQRIIMLIGNKCDLTLQRDVSSEEGEQFAKEHELLFMEVSAKTRQNIEEAVTTAASKIYKDVQDGVLDISKESSGVTFGLEAPLVPRAKTGAYIKFRNQAQDLRQSLAQLFYRSLFQFYS